MAIVFAVIDGVLINLVNVGSIRKTKWDDKPCILFSAANGDVLHRFYLPNEAAQSAYDKLAEYALYDFDEKNVPANEADIPATGKHHYRPVEHHVVDDLGNQLGKNGRNWFVYDCADRCAEILNAETAKLHERNSQLESFHADSMKVLDSVHDYVQGHRLGLGGEDVVKLLLEDANRLRQKMREALHWLDRVGDAEDLHSLSVWVRSARIMLQGALPDTNTKSDEKEQS